MKILSLFLCLSILCLILSLPVNAETGDIIFTSKISHTWKEKEFTPEFTTGMGIELGNFSVTNYYKVNLSEIPISLINWSVLYEKSNLLKNKVLTVASGIGTFSYGGTSSKLYAPVPSVPSSQVGSAVPSSFVFSVSQPSVTSKSKETSIFTSVVFNAPNSSLFKGFQASISGVYYPQFDGKGKTTLNENRTLSESVTFGDNIAMGGKCDASVSLVYKRKLKCDVSARYTIFGSYTPIASNITQEKSIDSSWFQKSIYFQPCGNHYLIQEAFVSVSDSSLQAVYGITQSPFGGTRKYFSGNSVVQIGGDFRGIFRGFIWCSDEGIYIPKSDGSSTENKCPVLVYVNPQCRLLFADDVVLQFGYGLSVKSTLSGGSNNFQTAQARSDVSANFKIHRFSFTTTVSSYYEKEKAHLIVTDKSIKYVSLNYPVMKNLVTGIFCNSQKTSTDCNFRYTFLLPMTSKLISDIGLSGSRESDINYSVFGNKTDPSAINTSDNSFSNSSWIYAKRKYGFSVKLSFAFPKITDNIKKLSLTAGTSWAVNFKSECVNHESPKGSISGGVAGQTGKISHSLTLSVSPITEGGKCKTELNYIVTLRGGGD